MGRRERRARAGTTPGGGQATPGTAGVPARRPDGGALLGLQAPVGRALPDSSLGNRGDPPVGGPRAVSPRRRSQGASAARPPCGRTARGHGAAAHPAHGAGRAPARLEPAGLGNLAGGRRGPGAPAPRRSRSPAGDRGPGPVHGARGRGPAFAVLRCRRRLRSALARTRGVRDGGARGARLRDAGAGIRRRRSAGGIGGARRRLAHAAGRRRIPVAAVGGGPGGALVAALSHPLPWPCRALLAPEAGRVPPEAVLRARPPPRQPATPGGLPRPLRPPVRRRAGDGEHHRGVGCGCARHPRRGGTARAPVARCADLGRGAASPPCGTRAAPRAGRGGQARPAGAAAHRPLHSSPGPAPPCPFNRISCTPTR